MSSPTWEDREFAKLLKEVAKPLLIQTPLQGMFEALMSKVQRQAQQMAELQTKMDKLQISDVGGVEVLDRLRLMEARLEGLTGQGTRVGFLQAPGMQGDVLQRLSAVEAAATKLEKTCADIRIESSKEVLPRIELMEQRLTGVYNIAGHLAAVDEMASELGLNVADLERQPNFELLSSYAASTQAFSGAGADRKGVLGSMQASIARGNSAGTSAAHSNSTGAGSTAAAAAVAGSAQKEQLHGLLPTSSTATAADVSTAAGLATTAAADASRQAADAANTSAGDLGKPATVTLRSVSAASSSGGNATSGPTLKAHAPAALITTASLSAGVNGVATPTFGASQRPLPSPMSPLTPTTSRYGVSRLTRIEAYIEATAGKDLKLQEAVDMLQRQMSNLQDALQAATANSASRFSAVEESVRELQDRTAQLGRTTQQLTIKMDKPDVSYAEFAQLQSKVEAAIAEVTSSSYDVKTFHDKEVARIHASLGELQSSVQDATSSAEAGRQLQTVVQALRQELAEIKERAGANPIGVVADHALAAAGAGASQPGTAREVLHLADMLRDQGSKEELQRLLANAVEMALEVYRQEAERESATTGATKFKCLVCDQDINRPRTVSPTRAPVLPKLDGIPAKTDAGWPAGPGMHAAEFRRLAEEKLGRGASPDATGARSKSASPGIGALGDPRAMLTEADFHGTTRGSGLAQLASLPEAAASKPRGPISAGNSRIGVRKPVFL